MLDQLRPLAKTVAMARSRFLYGLDQVPDNRLNWKPTETARSPLEQAGFAARFLHAMAHLAAEQTMPERPAAPPPPPASRAEARAMVEAGFDRLQHVIAGLTAADLEKPVPTPWGEDIPVLVLLWFLNGVIGYLQGQLNYIQLAYGDMDPNMPPDWGTES